MEHVGHTTSVRLRVPPVQTFPPHHEDMAVRVWMKPSDLGEAGYTIDFAADDWRRLKSGALHLIRETGTDAAPEEEIVGRVEANRWDAALILEP